MLKPVSIVLLLLAFSLPLSVSAQKKIANKIYKYGQVSSTLKGKVLIGFEQAGPKTDNFTISLFEKKGADAVSWNELYIPGTEYSTEYSTEDFR